MGSCHKLLRRAAKRDDAPANLPADSNPLVPKKKMKSKEATAQAEVVEDNTALDDEESLGTDATDQEAVLPTGGNVFEELASVRANKKAAQAKRNLAAGQISCFTQIYSARMPGTNGIKLWLCKLTQPHGPTSKAKNSPLLMLSCTCPLWTV